MSEAVAVMPALPDVKFGCPSTPSAGAPFVFDAAPSNRRTRLLP